MDRPSAFANRTATIGRGCPLWACRLHRCECRYDCLQVVFERTGVILCRALHVPARRSPVPENRVVYRIIGAQVVDLLVFGESGHETLCGYPYLPAQESRVHRVPIGMRLTRARNLLAKNSRLKAAFHHQLR